MDFIKFKQPHPKFPGDMIEVAVSLGQIVRIEPLYAQGDWHTDEEQAHKHPEATEAMFRLTDSRGNHYDSRDASPEGAQIILRLYNQAT